MGISRDAANESIEILHAAGQVQRKRYLSGHWLIASIPHGSLLRAVEARGTDVAGLRAHILAAIVNDSARSFKSFEDQPEVVTRALLQSLASEDLISFIPTLGGDILIRGFSPAARRLVRRS